MSLGPLRLCRLERPTEVVGQIGADDQPIRQHFVQACPFLLGVPCRLAVEQVSHLARVVLDVVKLILEPRAAEAEVNRIDPVALADGPNMPAGSTGRKEEEIVIGEDRMGPSPTVTDLE